MAKGTLDSDALVTLFGKSALLTRDLSASQLEAVLALAARLQKLDGEGADLRMLPGQLAYAMFFDNSTRTKSAWAGATARLGMSPVIVDGSSTQIQAQQ